MMAHVAGVPVEEAVLQLSGAGASLLLVAARLRKRGSLLARPWRNRRAERRGRPT